MDMTTLVSWLIFSPLIGVFVVACMPAAQGHMVRKVGIGSTFLPLIGSIVLFVLYHQAQPTSFAQHVEWIAFTLPAMALDTSWAIQEVVVRIPYHVDVNGISLAFVLLTTIVTCMAAWSAIHIQKRLKTFFILLLLLQVGMLGVFCARDVMLFFLFFELTLVPMFFLIGIYGFYDRERAANTFLVYNGLGSALLLIAFVWLMATAGAHVSGGVLQFSSDYATISSYFRTGEALVDGGGELTHVAHPFTLSEGDRTALFLLLLLAFGIKLPIFPLHPWMLRVHGEAHPAVVMIHSGILLKMGAYGLIVFAYGWFPAEIHAWGTVLAVLGVINIVAGALMACVQQDIKQVLAYSSISHMGIVLLGLAAQNEIGVQGAVFQLVSHGFISALLFLIVGMLVARAHTTDLRQCGGLAQSMPFLSAMWMVAGMASLGLPGLSGFVGEWLSFVGLFQTMPVLTVIGCSGMVWAAVYMLRVILRVTYGERRVGMPTYSDVRLVEAVPLVVLVSMIVLLGVYPNVLNDTTEAAIRLVVQPLWELHQGNEPATVPPFIQGEG